MKTQDVYLFLVGAIMGMLMYHTAHAEEAVDLGLGVFNSGKQSLSETKMLSYAYQENMWGPIQSRYTGGFWLDNLGEGHKNSLFTAAQLGFEVNASGLVGGVFTGPSLISSPDILLGGPFQFMDDIHLGIQDKMGNYFGVMYRHLSSAGLETPNIGRDVISLEIRF